MMIDSLIGGDVFVAVLTHTNRDLKSHRGVGGVAVRALSTQSTSTLTTMVLQ